MISRNLVRRSTLGILALLCTLPIYAADNASITKDQADAILTELRLIRQLLGRSLQPAGPSPNQQQPITQAKLKIEGGYMLGAPDAPLTMVEYSDLQCPFCQRYHHAAFAEIKKNYIDTGKLRYISRDLPLSIHSNAMPAAEAARCAGEENRYWEMRDTLVNNAGKLAETDILGYAEALHLNVPQFKACITGGKYKSAIQKEAAGAAAANIEGTPSFVIGRTTAEGVDGELVLGALPFANFEAKFQQFESAKPAR